MEIKWKLWKSKKCRINRQYNKYEEIVCGYNSLTTKI